MKNRYLLLCTLLIGTAGSLRAQDLRERTTMRFWNHDMSRSLK